MDFEDARRIFRGFELPRDGFEDLLAEVGKLRGAASAVQPARSAHQAAFNTATAKDGRAA